MASYDAHAASMFSTPDPFTGLHGLHAASGMAAAADWSAAGHQMSSANQMYTPYMNGMSMDVIIFEDFFVFICSKNPVFLQSN